MSKAISQAIQAASIGSVEASRDDQHATVKGLFMLFHAWYGNPIPRSAFIPRT